MPRFFIDKGMVNGNEVVIDGFDALHISRSLRMKVGEEIVLCDAEGEDMECRIAKITDLEVTCDIVEKKECEAEPKIEVVLYQCLPKGDKLESVVKKATELGVSRVVPVLSTRCISRPDGKSFAKRAERLKKIALEAAMQSGRGRIPEISDMMDFKGCIKEATESDLAIIMYEKNGESFSKVLEDFSGKRIAVIVGSEGGFEEREAEYAVSSGVKAVNLGKRILRTETAPICALSVIMYETGNLE